MSRRNKTRQKDISEKASDKRNEEEEKKKVNAEKIEEKKN